MTVSNLGNTNNHVCGEIEKSVYNCLQHPSSGNRNDILNILIFEDWTNSLFSEYPVKGRGNQTSDGFEEKSCGKKCIGDAWYAQTCYPCG